jgi:hypothetical protein
MEDRYKICKIAFDLDPIEREDDDETINKAWYSIAELGKCLFKAKTTTPCSLTEYRIDWSEKVVERIANLLGLPVAQCEFATAYLNSSVKPFEGVISVNCIPENASIYSGGFFLYQTFDNALERRYTVENILASLDLRNVKPSRQWTEDKKIPQIDKKGSLSVFNTFVRAAKLYSEAAQIWQDKLRSITPQQIKEIFDRIPEGRITPTSTKFAQDLLAFNQERILSLDLSLSQQLPEISSLNPTQVQSSSPATTSPVTLADLNDWKNNDDRVEQHPETGSLADINNLQSDDTQIAQRPTDGTLSDLNLSDESNTESGEVDDDLGDSNQQSL